MHLCINMNATGCARPKHKSNSRSIVLLRKFCIKRATPCDELFHLMPDLSHTPSFFLSSPPSPIYTAISVCVCEITITKWRLHRFTYYARIIACRKLQTLFSLCLSQTYFFIIENVEAPAPAFWLRLFVSPSKILYFSCVCSDCEVE